MESAVKAPAGHGTVHVLRLAVEVLGISADGCTACVEYEDGTHAHVPTAELQPA